MVEKCDCLCDIGSDHAYIPIDLVLRGIVCKVIASDIRKGPCKIALCNILENNLSDKIEVRMGNGFERIGNNECDSAVISGLGGHLMVNIFKESENITQTMNQIVIQPQNSLEYVREYLYTNGYDISDELLIYDEDKFYTVMSVKYTGIICRKDKIYYYIGQKLIENKDKYLGKYLEKEIKRLKRILKNVDKEECKWLLREYEKIESQIRYYTDIIKNQRHITTQIP